MAEEIVCDTISRRDDHQKNSSSTFYRIAIGVEFFSSATWHTLSIFHNGGNFKMADLKFFKNLMFPNKGILYTVWKDFSCWKTFLLKKEYLKIVSVIRSAGNLKNMSLQWIMKMDISIELINLGKEIYLWRLINRYPFLISTRTIIQ